MLIEYIDAALAEATYEILEDGTFYGEIGSCPGVWANADTLAGCQKQLRDALESWLIVGLRHGDHLPVINHIDLNPAHGEVA